MPRVGVQCLVRELGSDRLWGQKTNPLDRSNSVTNSVKTLKKKILLCDVLTPAWMSWIIRWNEVAYLEESAQCRVCNKYSVNASCDYCLYYYYCYYYYSPFHRWVKHVCLKCTFTHIILSRKVMDGKKKKKVHDGKGDRCLDHLVGFYITVAISSSIWNVHPGLHIPHRALLPVALLFRILRTELNCF